MVSAGFKAVVAIRFGGPEVLRVERRSRAALAHDEVRIVVRAAGLQPADARIREGWRPAGLTISPPLVLGNECAGIICELGHGVVGWSVGDEVIAFRMFGCHAEEVMVPAGNLVRKPMDLPWEVAGGLSAPGQAASSGLEALELKAGEKLVLYGASGCVGLCAIQLARIAGIDVLAVADERFHVELARLGASPVSPASVEAERLIDQADAVLDVAGHGVLDSWLGKGHRLVTLADLDRYDPGNVIGVRSDRSARRLEQIVRLAGQGDLDLPISRIFRIDEARDAHMFLARRGKFGKVLFRN